MTSLAKPFVHSRSTPWMPSCIDPDGRFDPELYDHYATFDRGPRRGPILRRAPAR